MATLTLTDARRLMLKGRPWTFRMECQVGGRNAFWLATGRGGAEPVEIHYGGIGNKPQIIVKDWAYVDKVAPEKEAKGYCYVQTPYVRVRQSTIDAFSAGQPSPQAPVTVVTPPVKPVSAPLLVPKTPMGIVLLVPGVRWTALNSQNQEVATLSHKDARKLVQAHPNIRIKGLGN